MWFWHEGKHHFHLDSNGNGKVISVTVWTQGRNLFPRFWNHNNCSSEPKFVHSIYCFNRLSCDPPLVWERNVSPVYWFSHENLRVCLSFLFSLLYCVFGCLFPCLILCFIYLYLCCYASFLFLCSKSKIVRFSLSSLCLSNFWSTLSVGFADGASTTISFKK